MGLIEELERYCHNLRFHKATGFREGTEDSWTASNCPECGERCSLTGDRVRVWPQDNGGRGGWSCRKCGATGDGIDLLRRYGVSYPDAYRAVLGTFPPDHWQKGKGSWWTQRQRKKHVKKRETPPLPVDIEAIAVQAARFHRVVDSPMPCTLPPLSWRNVMTALWHEARELLLTVPSSIDYLAERGINPDDAYLAGRFGWIPMDRFIRFDEVGLPPTGRYPAWALPAGLLEVAVRDTPQGTEVVGAAVHVLDRKRWPGKHMRCPGVQARSIVIPPLSSSGSPIPELVLLMEGALDALLLWQESCRSVLAVGVGAAGWLPDADADAVISAAVVAGAPIVLVPDLDIPGLRGVRTWQQRYPNAVVVKPEGGKDLTDAHLAAVRGSLDALTARAWLDRVRVGIQQNQRAVPSASLLTPTFRP